MTSSIADSAQRLVEFSKSQPLLVTAGAGTAIGLAALFSWSWQDYNEYLSYGKGGLPYIVWGWLISTAVLKPMGTNVLSVDLYDNKADKRVWLQPDWPAKGRPGSRPRLGPHPLPQRQLDQLASPEMHKKLVDAFFALAGANTDIVEVRHSVHEGHTKGIFLAKDVPASDIAQEMLGEISHIHGTTGADHSVHVTLAPQDCKKVISSGWGQRHPLDGVTQPVKWYFGWTIPKEYVLLYVPRNDEELKMVIEVVKASIGFMTGSEEVKDA